MVFAKNKKAYFDYEILEKYEAGIELVGVEVKSIRNNQVSIKEAFIRIIKKEVYIFQMNINDYKYGNIHNVDNKRERKLLFHKKEINKFLKEIKENGLFLVPITLYLKGNYIKLEVGLARSKKKYDKRETIKKRDTERDLNKYTKKVLN